MESKRFCGTAENAMAIGGMLVTRVIAGAIVFGVANAWHGDRALLPGLVVGPAVGIPALLISRNVGQTAATIPWVNVVWILGTFPVWGAALGVGVDTRKRRFVNDESERASAEGLKPV